MKNLCLKVPTKEDEVEWKEFVRDYIFDNPYARPLGCLEIFDYDKWLKKIENVSNGIDLDDNEVKSSTFFVYNNERIVGYVSVRHNIDTNYLSLYGGHIGYGIRPWDRRKGYGTEMLGLALEKCMDIGLEDVMVSCRVDNEASSKVIENNFGRLNSIVYIPEENCKFRIYNINVKEAVGNKEKVKVKERFNHE